ncbi:hypothetical protein ACFWOG_33370 [Kitasatospora sp. NPDC058406]|uniref:hypothetical protein n=1 Tax=Kitasatospora sp. NPDC058406 TaxID=3346483 RepID=UPI00365B9A8D
MRPKALGFWYSPESPGLPHPSALIDPDWSESERSMIFDCLEGGQLARRFMGVSSCRICGIPNGSAELTDGEFIWPAGLGHYMLEHSVRRRGRLPPALLRHALVRLADLEEASTDRSWWLATRTMACPWTPTAANSGRSLSARLYADAEPFRRRRGGGVRTPGSTGKTQS